MPTLKITEKALATLPPPTLDPGAPPGSKPKPQEYYWDTEIKGLGVVVGRTGVKTFVAFAWIAGTGRKRRVKIGVAGSVRADGHTWTVALARKRAKELLADAAKGIDRNAEKHAAAEAISGAITLRQALALYGTELRDNRKAEPSIRTVEYDVPRLLAKEMDRPLSELTVEAVQRIKERGRAHKTQTNRLLAHISAIWNTTLRLRRSTLNRANPVGRTGVQKYRLVGEDEPSRERVEAEDMAEWYRRIETLAPLRRDLQLAALFTGLRDSNVTTMRWEMIDAHRGALLVPRSKTTPFAIPLSATVLELLDRRRAQNAIQFEADGGDHGWIFPSLARGKARRVIATSETKERRSDLTAKPWGSHRGEYQRTGERMLYLPGLHALRRTFISVGHECGVSDLDLRVLTNHKIGGRDVHERYVHASFEHLREQTTKIDAALWARLR